MSRIFRLYVQHELAALVTANIEQRHLPFSRWARLAFIRQLEADGISVPPSILVRPTWTPSKQPEPRAA